MFNGSDITPAGVLSGSVQGHSFAGTSNQLNISQYADPLTTGPASFYSTVKHVLRH